MSSGRCQRCEGDVATTMGLGGMVGAIMFGIAWYYIAWKVMLKKERRLDEDGDEEDGEEAETPLMKTLRRFRNPETPKFQPSALHHKS